MQETVPPSSEVHSSSMLLTIELCKERRIRNGFERRAMQGGRTADKEAPDQCGGQEVAAGSSWRDLVPILSIGILCLAKPFWSPVPFPENCLGKINETKQSWID